VEGVRRGGEGGRHDARCMPNRGVASGRSSGMRLIARHGAGGVDRKAHTAGLSLAQIECGEAVQGQEGRESTRRGLNERGCAHRRRRSRGTYTRRVASASTQQEGVGESEGKCAGIGGAAT